jgi:hypothetical protein
MVRLTRQIIGTGAELSAVVGPQILIDEAIPA